MTMALIWLETWLMGMLKERDRSMKLMRLPRDSIFPPDSTHSAPPTMARMAYWT